MKFFLLSISFLMSLQSFGQVLNINKPARSLGGQIGFTFQEYNTIEGGLNYYWSNNPSFESGKLRAHTFGPFLCAELTFIDGVTYVGERIGVNYHYLNLGSFQISPTLEHIAKNDFRIGSDIGLSFMGIYAYYGYYFPIGNEQMPELSTHRFGIRIVFNMASVLTTKFD